ncbi:MAG TPA: hypothetical protein VG992_00330 [Candidatus Saccharimonadales bacterium]|nr:hypothetical protein [Candidatus Saccharimonadales bacterium]
MSYLDEAQRHMDEIKAKAKAKLEQEKAQDLAREERARKAHEDRKNRLIF